jgi:hypothetical protein
MNSLQLYAIRGVPPTAGLLLCIFFLRWPTAHCWPGDCIVNRGSFWAMLESGSAFERIGGVSVLGGVFYIPLAASVAVAFLSFAAAELFVRKYRARAQLTLQADAAAPRGLS